ncbi:MAG: hypothetical protein ACRYG7_50540 [Janthinobacterium lividum]
MELNDLRQQWQQPEPVGSTAFTKEYLDQVLAQKSGSVVAKLRRNARVELSINYALMLSSLALAIWAQLLWLRLFGGLLTLLAAVCIYYFYRKLGLLRSMDNPTDDLRGHLLRLTQGLRALMRFYYRLTMATIPATMLICGLIALHEMPKLRTPVQMGLLLGALQVLGLLIYLPTKHTTNRYLQKLYGQHLDRLEGQLRELEDKPAGTGASSAPNFAV